MNARAAFRRPFSAFSGGFTILELMIVLVILGVLVSVAAPSFTNAILLQRVKTASFDVIASLSFARSEAIKQNGNVTILPNGGNWANGWTITGPSGTLRTQAAFENIAITGPGSLVFGRSGRITSGSGNIQIDDTESNAAVEPRCIVIGVTGLPKSKTGAC